MAQGNYYSGFFNLGTDLSMSIIDNNTNQPIDLGGRLVSFSADPGIKEIISEPIDNLGYDQLRQIWGRWNGELMIDRATGGLDLLISQLEQEYHSQQPQHYFTINCQIFNSQNNGYTNWTFNYCTIEATKTGMWKKDSKVEVTIKFTAQNRPVTGV